MNSKHKKKNAAVYDRWLFTLGGGEQVAFAYAEALRDLGYETTLISHQEIDPQKAQAKMGVDLSDINLLYLPQMSSEQLAEYTEKFDVFINTSYLDYFPNRSKLGILSIFFPGQIFLTPYEYLKRVIVLPSFKRLFIYPSSFHGFKYDEYRKGKIYKWMSKSSGIVFNQDVSDFSITLYARSFGVSLVDETEFYLESVPVIPYRKRILDKNEVEYSFHLRNNAQKTFRIILPDSDHSKNVALVRLTIFSWKYLLYNLFKRMCPKWEMRLHGGPGVTKLSDLVSYNHIITISEFSRKWIKKYWGIQSDILYPPVATEKFKSGRSKKNIIVHVGRFFVTGHNKKQLDLVKAFGRLIDEKHVECWELHFVGSVHEGEKHRQYFEQVKYYARDYPVVFHLDAPFSELRDVLSRSKIYWHATGLDENEDKNPILFEHFGITTVEAMASGCVPVVIHAGGQKEIVNSENGFTWKTRDELIEKTFQLIQNGALLKRLSRAAVERSKHFSKKQFRARFKKLLLGRLDK